MSTAGSPRLTRLLRPSSIAVIGGAAAEQVMERCQALGFGGELWPVHPQRASIAGRPCFPSVDALPAAPDAAFVGVNRQRSVDVVRALAARGAGGAVCYAAGFSESGDEGARLERALVAASGAMPLVGPNCHGFVNYLDGALLWPDQHGGASCERGVAVLTQSGNIAINLTMGQRGLPLAYVISSGNQARTGMSELIEALADDERVSAIGLHMEGLDDVTAFSRAVDSARARGRPVVALKAGHSAAGAALARSHTASMAGADAAFDSLLERLGVARVHSLPVLLETLKLLHVVGPLAGPELVVMSCSGGEAALVADAAHGRRLELRPFTERERARIADTVHALVSVTNPFDYHTFDWNRRDRLQRTFSEVLACGFDLGALVLDLPRQDRCLSTSWDAALEAFVGAARATGRPAAVLSTLHECMPEARAGALTAAGVAPLLGIDDALAAIEAAACMGDPPPAPFVPLAPPAPPPARTRDLDEWQAKRALAAHGVRTPPGELCRSAAAAVEAARRLGYPVAMKAVAARIVHKSDAGAVRLGLGDEASVAEAYRALRRLSASVIVERMVPNALAELIVGIARDPAVGLFLMLGTGGIYTEVIADRELLMLPTDGDRIRTALARLRGAALLSGARGRPRADVDAAIAAVLAMQGYAREHAQTLHEMEVNPLMVCAQGDGAVAVDALIRLREE